MQALRIPAPIILEYKAGKIGKLAQIIATGINEEAGAICQMEESAGEEMMGGIAASKSMIKLLNADPNLKDAAFKAGMKEKNLWTVEGAQELAVLHQKAADANVKLFQAAVDGKELPPQEKAQAVKDIIKGKVALESMLVDNKKSQREKIDTYFAKFAQGVMPPTEKDNPRQVRYYDENGGLIMPKKGVPYMTSGVHMTESMKRYYKEKPASVMLLKTPTGKKNLDTIADQIVAEDKLLDLSTKDLANKLNFAGSQVNMKYGERGIRKMAEQGMVTKDTMQELKHELKTGQASSKMEQPKKAEQVVQAEINIQNKGKMVEGNQPGIR